MFTELPGWWTQAGAWGGPGEGVGALHPFLPYLALCISSTWLSLSYVLSQSGNLVSKVISWILWGTLANEGVLWELLIYSLFIDAQWWGRSGGTEPLTCGMWCQLLVDGVRIALNYMIVASAENQRIGWCGKPTQLLSEGLRVERRQFKGQQQEHKSPRQDLSPGLNSHLLCG